MVAEIVLFLVMIDSSMYGRTNNETIDSSEAHECDDLSIQIHIP